MELYEWIWFHFEFWLPPAERRPFTVIFRDLYHQAPGLVVPLLGFGFYGLSYWLELPAWVFAWAFASFMIGELCGHLFWGKDYVPGQMPPPKVYIPSVQVRAWVTKARLTKGGQNACN